MIMEIDMTHPGPRGYTHFHEVTAYDSIKHFLFFSVSSVSGAGKTRQLMCKRVKLEPFLILYTKINSKWVKYLNYRPETIKLLKEKIGRILFDINGSKILYDTPPRVMEIKTE